MNLTGKQLVDQGIITKADKECIQQHGVDLRLIRVSKMLGVGQVPNDFGKTKLVEYEEVPIIYIKFKEAEHEGWHLEPGAYNIEFSQGCVIPSDKMCLIRQRSSMLRNGTTLHSSVFDAGFKTDNIGTVMIVHHPIEIAYGARIAQIYAHNSNKVENLYNGQWQGDKQREKAK